MSSEFNVCFICSGVLPPTDVIAEQTGFTTVHVMWTAPPAPPTGGYRVQITVESTTTTTDVTTTAHTFSVINNQYGVYSIQVISLSLGGAADPVEVTVRGMQWEVHGAI